jgi:hypothetical protein
MMLATYGVPHYTQQHCYQLRRVAAPLLPTGLSVAGYIQSDGAGNIIIIIIIITRVSSGFIVHEATSLPRCRLGHHQTNPAI